MALALNTDALNQGIIEILRGDPGTTNKEIGERLGVSEVTVASRIRSMEEANVLRIMMQRDVRTLNYNVMALLDINVEAARPEDVAEELARIEECISVSICMSKPDIIVHILAYDNAHLQDLIDTRISSIKGIRCYEVNIPLEVMKMHTHFGMLDQEYKNEIA